MRSSSGHAHNERLQIWFQPQQKKLRFFLNLFDGGAFEVVEWLEQQGLPVFT
jgi:hypothetical protein